MKRILTLSALLLLVSGNAQAGSEYDSCIKEEKTLKTKEASECSGFRYLLNPSACFSTRKALKEYTSGRCKKIGMAENVALSTQKVVPEKTIISDVSSREKKVETEVPQQESTCEQLKAENTRLKAEVRRLEAENGQLKKTSR